MKTTKCVLCGREFSIQEDTAFGQHILCPYCNGKFSYLVDSTEFSKERLAYAISECRKNKEDCRYYDAAPAGARLYIGLVFYGKVFKDHLNRDLYLAEMVEIESELKAKDWKYLVDNEDDHELVEYFKSKLPVEQEVRAPAAGETESYAGPVQGVLRYPASDRVQKKKVESKEPVIESPHRISSYLVLIAGVLALVVGGFVLVSSFRAKQPEPPTIQSEVDDGKVEKYKLSDIVSKQIEILKDRQKQIDRSIEEVRSNKTLFMCELNRMIEDGNVKSAELQTKGAVRLHSAETVMSILKAPFFNAFAIRYCGDKPFEKATECRQKIQKSLDEKRDLTPSGMDAINQLAVACQDKSVGEVRRAINEKYNSLVALRKTISKGIQNLTLEQIEIVHLDTQKLAEKKVKLEQMFQNEAFTTECGLVNIDAQLKATEPAKDEFSLAGRIQNESADQESSSAGAETNRHVGTIGNVLAVSKKSQTTENKLAGKSSQTQAEYAKRLKTTVSAVETDSESEKTESQPKKPKGRRQKCKSPNKCMNFAEPGHNFCPDHECHSYGCKEHVRTVSSPNWIHGGLKSISSLDSTQRNLIKRKCLGRYCFKHCCKRVCPEIKNYQEWYDDYLYWDNDKTEKFFFCDNERMAKSPYCADHACPLPTCNSCREEQWKLDDGTGGANVVGFVDPHEHWWCNWRKWILLMGSMCRAHGNVDPNSVPERDKRTSSDLIREKEEKKSSK